MSGTSGTGRKLAALYAVTLLLAAPVFGAFVGPVGATVAGNDTVVTAGNVVYQTDAELTVTDATSADLSSGNPFLDSGGLALLGLTLSSAGNAPAAVTVEQRTGTETRLSGLDTSSTDVTVDPNDKQPVTLGGGFVTFDYEDPTFEVAGVDFDFRYTSDAATTLSFANSGLASTKTVDSIDTGDGTVLDSGTVDATGLLQFTGLPVGSYQVNLSEGDTEPPVAEAGSDLTVDEDDPLTFDGTNSADNGVIDSYEWDWTSDGTYDATGATPTHTYSAPNTYTVTLRVTDRAGQTDTDTLTVYVDDTGGRDSDGSSDGDTVSESGPEPTQTESRPTVTETSPEPTAQVETTPEDTALTRPGTADDGEPDTARQGTVDEESIETQTETPTITEQPREIRPVTGRSGTDEATGQRQTTPAPASGQDLPATTTGSGPFSPVLTLIALLVVGLLARRRGGVP